MKKLTFSVFTTVILGSCANNANNSKNIDDSQNTHLSQSDLNKNVDLLNKKHRELIINPFTDYKIINQENSLQNSTSPLQYMYLKDEYERFNPNRHLSQ
nr:hypothetical protein [uncultured Chryseobacterium sp.]